MPLVAMGDCEEFGAAVDAEAAVELFHIFVNGVDAEADPAGDLFIAVARQEADEHRLQSRRRATV